MTTLQSNPGVTIRLSTLERGGWECWVCNQVTQYECFVLTRNGPRWLPCCTVECYQHLPAAYERFAIGQSQGVSGVLFPPLNEKRQPQQGTGETMIKRFWRWLKRLRGYGFTTDEGD